MTSWKCPNCGARANRNGKGGVSTCAERSRVACCGFLCECDSRTAGTKKQHEETKKPMKIFHHFFKPDEIKQLIALADDPQRVWEDGRQKTGYVKSLVDRDVVGPLIARSLECLTPTLPAEYDAYFVMYPEDAHLEEHVDPPLRAGDRHVRLNVLLVAPEFGGEFTLDDMLIRLRVGDAIVFHPDQQKHSLSLIERGRRLIWSVGCNHACPVVTQGSGVGE